MRNTQLFLTRTAITNDEFMCEEICTENPKVFIQQTDKAITIWISQIFHHEKALHSAKILVMPIL